eukprot:4353664-Heterocapsa_arctica.AAC.1
MAYTSRTRSSSADWGAQRDVRVVGRCDSGATRRLPMYQEAGQMTAPVTRQPWLQQQVLEDRVPILSVK